MTTDRKIAISVGTLFIIGTIAGVLSVTFTTFDDPNYLVAVAANENQVIIGALCVLTMGLSLALIPVVIFPLLKKHSESLALGYVVFRSALEPIMYIATVVSILLLVTVSREYVGMPEAENFEALGVVLQEAIEWFNRLTTPVFVPGALILYYVLYQERLVPRWLSGWGLISVIPVVIAAFLGIFGELSPEDSADTLLHMPLALQEMVMAVWLIVRGFNSSAISSE